MNQLPESQQELLVILLTVAFIVLGYYGFKALAKASGSDLFDPKKRARRLRREQHQAQQQAENIPPLPEIIASIPPEVKAAAKNFFTYIAKPTDMQRASNNTAFVNSIKVNQEASKMGVTPEVYLQLKQKEHADSLAVKTQAEGAQLAISAGLEVNAQKFRRQQQLLEEIGKLEEQLEHPTLKNIQRQLIEDSIKSKRAEYEQLGQSTI